MHSDKHIDARSSMRTYGRINLLTCLLNMYSILMAQPNMCTFRVSHRAEQALAFQKIHFLRAMPHESLLLWR